MCKNATSTAASLMAAIRPTLVSLLSATGVNGASALAAFDAAQKALAAWTPGTTSATVTEALGAFSSIFAVLPIPEDAKTLESIIVAGIVTVLGVIEANSPAPVPATAVEPAVAAHPEEVQAAHALTVAHKTELRVGLLVPGFKRSVFHSAPHQYKSEWNKAVDRSAPKYAHLKQ